MVFKIDFLGDGRVLEWEKTSSGVRVCRVDGYTPRFYIGSRSPSIDLDLEGVREWYRGHPDVVDVGLVSRRPGFRRGEEEVLAVDVDHVSRVSSLARQVRQLPGLPVGDAACYNVDFSRGFRYCLEQGVDPTPQGGLSRVRLDVPVAETSGDQYSQLMIDEKTVSGTPREILAEVQEVFDRLDPDLVVCSTAEVVPTLYSMAETIGFDEFSLSRGREGYQKLASRSTFTSYGRIGHSPARYNLFGRVVIDRSNSFFFGQTNLVGLLDLVGRSWKPVQEASWASIGNILTAIQIREADSRGVLVPWRSWRHEFFKSAGTLHDADRGGFIASPDVGVHNDVHELDFSSLYPNIICTRNVSPDVIRCSCHNDRSDVPVLGYSICDRQGYLADVLQPLIDDRDEIKAEIRREKQSENPSEDRLETLEDRSSALKWILVACFGYQGFDNAKFGRIECHEAINSFAREILLDTKQRLEEGGWKVLHAIVDSVWVTADPDTEQEDLQMLAEEITEEQGIRLEYEARYNWVVFVPQRDSSAGALTKYFGRVSDEDKYKVRGIEARQRSTPEFIEKVQRTCIKLFDEHRSAEPVLEYLDQMVTKLYRGEVDPQSLVEKNRVSKPVEQYTQNNLNVAALQRTQNQGISVHPGQDVEYVVVDNEKRSQERVVLAHEQPDTYDPEYYENK